MRTESKIKVWDKKIAKFVEIPIAKHPESDLSCSQCRYYDHTTGYCNGVGSWFYDRKVPNKDYVPKVSECEIRLPLDLLAYI
ncbi:MAG: hypothetical protein BAJATHORv1_20521 [Candidatus Thorarchaeota archaeon]|nr:MAG: hypothetical protein BAJATHORv1_20521 [Candidatus Thorarchaeota archaeon]